MDSQSKVRTEQFLAEAFTGLLHIAQRSGITVKRMRELMAMVQVREMKWQGMTHQQIKAASGFSLKTIRQLLKMDLREDRSDPVARFVAEWTADPDFPETLSLDEVAVPNYLDLCARHGGEFHPGPLLDLLAKRGFARVRHDRVVLTAEGRKLRGLFGERKTDGDAGSSGDADATTKTDTDYSLVVRLAGRWLADPDFPAKLSLRGNAKRGFAALCARYAPGRTPLSVLQILKAYGKVQVQGGHVRIDRSAVIAESEIDKLETTAASMAALLGTIEHNLAAQAPAFIERRYFSQYVPDARVETARARVRKLTIDYGEQVLKTLMELEERNAPSPDSCGSEIGVGVYWFER